MKFQSATALLTIMLLLIVQHSDCALRYGRTLKSPKKDKVLRSVVRKIIKTNDLKGFFVLNLIRRDKNPVVIAKSKELLREVSSLAAVTNIDRRLNKRTERKFMRNRNKRLVHYHVAATDNVYFIVIVNSYQLSNIRKNVIPQIQDLNLHYSLAQSVTKTLLVTILDKPYRNYKYLLRSMPDKLVERHYLHNIDVLEIVIRQSRKRSAPRLNYQVIQLDFSQTILRKTKYSSRAKFFVDSMKNLHQRILPTHDLIPHMQHFIESMKKQSRFDVTPMLALITYFPLTIIVKGLNGTLVLVNRTNNLFFHCSKTQLTTLSMDEKMSCLLPVKQRQKYYIAPVLYDELHEADLSGLLFSLFAMAVIIFTFKWYSEYFHFDSLTWQPMRIFSMIIGVANPRNPVRFGETLGFVLLIAVGFYAGSDIVLGLFSTKIVRNIERKLDSVEDFARNNISFEYNLEEDKQNFPKVPNLKWSRSGTLKDLLLYKNQCILNLDAFVECCHPDRIIVNNQILAKMSNIMSDTDLSFWLVPRCCPWFHHMNYYLMAYYERNLGNTRDKKIFQSLYTKKQMGTSIEDFMRSTQQESDDETEELGYLWLLVAFGFVAPLFALAVEVLLKRVSCKTALKRAPKRIVQC